MNIDHIKSFHNSFVFSKFFFRFSVFSFFFDFFCHISWQLQKIKTIVCLRLPQNLWQAANRFKFKFHPSFIRRFFPGSSLLDACSGAHIVSSARLGLDENLSTIGHKSQRSSSWAKHLKEEASWRCCFHWLVSEWRVGNNPHSPFNGILILTLGRAGNGRSPTRHFSLATIVGIGIQNWRMSMSLGRTLQLGQGAHLLEELETATPNE